MHSRRALVELESTPAEQPAMSRARLRMTGSKCAPSESPRWNWFPKGPRVERAGNGLLAGILELAALHGRKVGASVRSGIHGIREGGVQLVMHHALALDGGPAG